MWILPIVHFKQNSSKQICRRWLSQQSSLLLCKSPVFLWRPLILKRSAWCKRGWRRIPSDSGSGFPYILKSYNLYRWKWSNLHNWFHKNLSPPRRSNRQGTCQSNAPKVLNEAVLDVTDQEVPSPHGPSSLGSLIDTGRPHRYWKEIKIKFTTNDMSNWAQKLEDRLCISSVLWLIPYVGFFNGVDRLMDKRTP